VIEDLNVLDTENYFRIVDLALENKVTEIMVLLNDIINHGFDGGNMVLGLASHVRNVMMAKDPQTLPLLEVSEQQRIKYQEQAQRCPTSFLYKALKIMNQCDINYRQSNSKRLLVELTLIQVAQITQPDDEEAGAGRSPKRLKSLFKNLIRHAQPKAALPQVTAAKPVASPTTSIPGNTSQSGNTSSTSSTSSPSSHAAPTVRLGGIGFSWKNLRQ
jgi:DNA polymerase-3 subunit gamma/tau